MPREAGRHLHDPGRVRVAGHLPPLPPFCALSSPSLLPSQSAARGGDSARGSRDAWSRARRRNGVRRRLGNTHSAHGTTAAGSLHLGRVRPEPAPGRCAMRTSTWGTTLRGSSPAATAPAPTACALFGVPQLRRGRAPAGRAALQLPAVPAGGPLALKYENLSKVRTIFYARGLKTDRIRFAICDLRSATCSRTSPSSRCSGTGSPQPAQRRRPARRTASPPTCARGFWAARRRRVDDEELVSADDRRHCVRE